MPKDPYAILRALVRAESLRNAPKPPSEPGRGAPKPAPERRTRSGKPERG
ncbi:hypothetical protein QFZ75_003767 [Streptomyces sp. V3I8]|jgi:hypothetical protein|nr:hypothetical protein [Streptomyces sp. V3I8]MDQ1037351.1 hypothetical protein [Streptomyces sp. V3I8]